jgi:cation:H+ antiporter
MLLDILLLGGGIALVILGANWLVDGASALALRLNIPPLIIGLTVVAFGTSTPELTVSVISAYTGKTDIAVGNIVGSNIFNILFILGVSSLITPLKVASSTVWKEIPLSLLAAIVLYIGVNDVIIDQGPIAIISRIDGIILLLFFVIFLYYTFIQSRVGANAGDEEDIKPMAIWKSVVFIAIGLVALVYGGKFMVDGASHIALGMGVPEAVVGLTIVAIGTSMPELATSVVAAYKKKSDIAVGNVVGSNIFNIFFILGVSATVAPLPLGNISQVDLWLNIIASVLLFMTAYIGRGHKLTRLEGILLLLVYMAYMVYLIRIS